MAFEQKPVNYASQYAMNLAQAFPYVLYYGDLYATPNNGRFRWVNGKTIEVPHIDTSGRTNANNDTIGTRARRWGNEWKSLTLRNHRSWETLIAPTDIDFTNGAASIQNITQVYNNEQKFPEMDAYLVSRLYADWIELGKVPYTDELTPQNILTVFDRLMERMTNKRVPAVGRILYVTPNVETMLKNAIAIQRQVGATGLNSTIDRAVSNLDKVKIVTVPDELMKTVYNFDEGWEPGASAKQIKMFLVHPNAVITPVSYEFAKLDAPSAGSQGKYDYYEESFEDAFICPFKESAIEFVIQPSEADSLVFATSASTETGALVGDCKVVVTSAKKNAANKYAYVSGTVATAVPSLGDDIDMTVYAPLASGEVVEGITNGNSITVVEVNADGRCVAGGVETAVSKTA